MIKQLCLSLLMPVVLQSNAMAGVTCVSPANATIVIEENGSKIVTSLVAKQIKIGAQFAIELLACEGIEKIRSIDARMPAHGHGMNYQPTLTRTAQGQYLAEGFLFHMPGTWELMIDAEKDGERVKLRKGISVLP